MAARLRPDAAWLAQAVAEHHERLDGTGYPAGLRGAQLTSLSRLLAVCDVYAAVLYGAAVPQSQGAAHGPDRRASDGRQRRAGSQPCGTAVGTVFLSCWQRAVEMTDGSLGLVTATPAGRREGNGPARPVVAILTTERGESLPAARHIDLMRRRDYGIVRTCRRRNAASCWGRGSRNGRKGCGGAMSKTRRRIFRRDAPSVAVSAVRHAAAGGLRGRRLLAGRRSSRRAAQRRRQLGSLRPDALGLPFFWLPPLVLVLMMAGWNLLRQADKPGDLVGVLSGMALESVAFALGLWGLSRGLVPLMQQLGVQMEISGATEPALRQVVTYLGAGIYEEALFRLTLYSEHGLAAASHGIAQNGCHGCWRRRRRLRSSRPLIIWGLTDNPTTIIFFCFAWRPESTSPCSISAAASASPSERTPATT